MNVKHSSNFGNRQLSTGDQSPSLHPIFHENTGPCICWSNSSQVREVKNKPSKANYNTNDCVVSKANYGTNYTTRPQQTAFYQCFVERCNRLSLNYDLSGTWRPNQEMRGKSENKLMRGCAHFLSARNSAVELLHLNSNFVLFSFPSLWSITIFILNKILVGEQSLMHYSFIGLTLLIFTAFCFCF